MGYWYKQLTFKEQKEVDRLINEQLYIEYGIDLLDISETMLDIYRERITNSLYGTVIRSPIIMPNNTHEKFISRMELLIQDILTHDIEIEYDFDKQFKNQNKISKLKFDFVLNNGLIIEYDGEQHFHELLDFKYKYGYNYLQGLRNDNLKNEFCLAHNVPLLRIPYGLYHTCSKQTRRQLCYLIRYFIEMNLVTDEIVKFYEDNSESNYFEIVVKQNELIKRERKKTVLLA